jgi:Cu2+-containing amine oxidase
MIYQSTHTKYAAAGAIAVGAMLTANSSAWVGLLDGDVEVTEIPFNSLARDAGPGGKAGLVPGCVGQNISFAVGSQWNLCVKAVNQFGLIISAASFKKTRTSRFITILFDGRLGEIFVPYHPGTPRFGDISGFNFPPLTLGARDCPLPGRVLIDGNQICREIRDRGIAWKDHGLVHRGEEVVYFAVLNAANYNYVMEWSFWDDGTIATRAGSSGPKIGGADDTIGHMHNFTWRFDIDLNGSCCNTAFFTRHIENPNVPNSSAFDISSLIRFEAGLDWTPAQFNTVVIQDRTLINGRGRHTQYELIPLRTGTSRHSEAFTKHDFWVSVFKPTEILANGLPSYVNDRESTVNRDLVIWYTGSAHHENNMRDEDRQTVPVIWTGVMLQPQNLYDGTPFF